MPLPSSGSISFAQIATELGRTGTAVSLNQADVAALAGKTTSQQIVLPNDFWGKSANDFTPNAVDWANISGTSGALGHSNASQTIAGISSSVVLRPTISGLSTAGIITNGSITVVANLNSVNLWTHSGGITNNTITVNNGDSVNFIVTIESNQGPVSVNCSINVVNTSDGNASLDTFTVNVSQFE